MIEVYKMCNKKYDEDMPLPLIFSQNTFNTRGIHKSTKSKVNKNLGKYSFKNRVVNLWNKLPDSVKSANTINTFKNRIDDLWNKQGIMYDYEKCLDFTEQHMNIDFAGSLDLIY